MSELDDDELKATRKLNGADISVGDYVRTKNGSIGKFLYHGKDNLSLSYIKLNYRIICVDINEILKHSKKIIGIIEKGDYVNGKLAHFVGVNFIEYIDGETVNIAEIKTVVTSEQFNSVMYKVGE